MTTILKYALITASLCGCSTHAFADISVSFNESAPKDWFEFTNQSNCDFDGIKFAIDLTPSAGKLIFDTLENGQGVEVFQPFEVREGQIRLSNKTQVADGGKSLEITIDSLLAGQSASFTIDVDDTLKDSALGMIRVSNTEILGATISIETADGQISKRSLDSMGELVLPSPDCDLK